MKNAVEWPSFLISRILLHLAIILDIITLKQDTGHNPARPDEQSSSSSVINHQSVRHVYHFCARAVSDAHRTCT